MEVLYPLVIAFVLVFVSELGDKTQLLVISFAGKQKAVVILLGVALGSFLSHGIAILFGSTLGLVENETIANILKLITYLSFLIFGVLTLTKKEKEDNLEQKKSSLLKKITKIKLNYVVLIALSIAIGELGDKTFLASIGLGIQYPNTKISLIIGAILGMVMSDLLAIIFGKMLSRKISEKTMEKISGILFLIFGVLGIVRYFA